MSIFYGQPNNVFNNFAFDATSIRVGSVVKAPKTGTISAVWLLNRAITSSQSVTVSLQDIDASSNPDGTADQSGTYTPSVADTLSKITLGSGRSVTLGDRFAVVAEWTGAAGSLNYVRSVPNGQIPTFPTGVTYASGAWSKTHVLALALEYSDGSIAYIDGIIPLDTLTLTYNSSTSSGSGGDERGFRVTPPVSMVCSGARLHCGNAASGTYTVILADASGTTLRSDTMGSDYVATGNRSFEWADITLNANQNYYVFLRPNGTQNAVLTVLRKIPSDAFHEAFEAPDMRYAYRTDGGSITIDTQYRVIGGLIVESFPAVSGRSSRQLGRGR